MLFYCQTHCCITGEHRCMPSTFMYYVFKSFLSVAKFTKCALNSCFACAYTLANKTPKSHIWNGFVSRKKKVFCFGWRYSWLRKIVEESPMKRDSLIITCSVLTILQLIDYNNNSPANWRFSSGNDFLKASSWCSATLAAPLTSSVFICNIWLSVGKPHVGGR